MLNGYIISSVFIALCFVLLGLVVVSRNYKSVVNRIFVALSTFMAIWLISNYLAGDSSVNENIALYSNRVVFGFGLISTATILFFIKKLTNIPIKKIDKVLIVLNIISFVGSFTPLIVESIYPEGPTYLIKFGWLSNVYFITILLNFILITKTLLHSRKISTGTLRDQLYVIEISFVISLISILITNAFFPFILGFFWLTNIGSFSSAFIVIGIAYAILKHKLFDIRLIVARSLGYILTITTLVGSYAFLITFVSSGLFSGDSISGGQTVLYIATTLIFGFSLPPLKRFFDRLTNRLFYQDAYDVQAFLDEFNKTLVGNIVIQPLLRQSAELIETTLKAESCVFEIHATESSPRRLIGSKTVSLSEEEVSMIMAESENIHQSLIITDELEEKNPDLKAILSKNNIAVLSQLNSAVKKTKDLGYLILGQKKSGNPYNKQDLQVLEIISNELVIAVQNALRFEEIQEFTVTLQEKVEDRTKELRKANEKLKALDETKDEFISMASHQLRTPLTAVKGYLSMVVEGDAGKVAKPQKELLDQAFASSQRMVYLIADLLNVSRLKTGKFVIENKATQLAEVVESEMHQLTEMAASKNQTLTFNKPAKFPEMMLDETKMRQVIMNFADNALHYTPNDGHIQLNLIDKPESIEYTVVDDGLGVPKTEQHHLFTKFYRANNAKKARPDGTGLGLFMAKKVIIAQGGAVIFNSEENKGSTFGFTIPKNAKTLAPKHNASATK